MPRYHNINGNKVQFTAAEEAARDAEEKAWADGEFDREIAKVRAKRNILIAGCGTGQQLVNNASYENSDILAVDLSLSSLAYAKRKSDELAIKNIEYLQADILYLDKLERNFDIIESVGVLHHMSDPMDGWAVLVNRLKPGCLIKVGLYSELARQHIVKIRDEINNADIRLFGGCIRDSLINKELKDIDTATTLEPNEVINLLQNNNIEYDDFAIQYGSIISYPLNQKIRRKLHFGSVLFFLSSYVSI